MKTCLAMIPVLALTMLSACKTPTAALDSANNGAALSSALTAELREFNRVQNVVAKHRIDNIRNQLRKIEESRVMANNAERILEASEQTHRLKLYAKLRALSDGGFKDEADLAAANKKIDSMLEKLVKPLPASAEKLPDVEKAFAAMGQEISIADRAKVVYAFAQEVKKTVDENAKKIEDAENSAPKTAPTQTVVSDQ